MIVSKLVVSLFPKVCVRKVLSHFLRTLLQQAAPHVLKHGPTPYNILKQSVRVSAIEIDHLKTPVPNP